MPHISNDGIAIHYRIEGSGSPLVLQHGFTDSSESWYELGYVDALKAKYRLILPYGERNPSISQGQDNLRQDNLPEMLNCETGLIGSGASARAGDWQRQNPI